MEFVVFQKVGEFVDKNGDWDGDDGYNEVFEISNGEVESHIKELIVNQYFDKKKDSENYRKAYEMLTEVFDNINVFDELTELFEQELQDWAQELYENQ